MRPQLTEPEIVPSPLVTAPYAGPAMHNAPETQAGNAEVKKGCGGFVIGVIVDVDLPTLPLISHPYNISRLPIRARTTVALSAENVGREAVLVFEEADPMRPVVMGLLRITDTSNDRVSIQLDGEKVVLRADKEVVLRCGEASITLTHTGKLLICGKYVLSRSKGVNRIKGASVQIN